MWRAGWLTRSVRSMRSPLPPRRNTSQVTLTILSVETNYSLSTGIRVEIPGVGETPTVEVDGDPPVAAYSSGNVFDLGCRSRAGVGVSGLLLFLWDEVAHRCYSCDSRGVLERQT